MAKSYKSLRGALHHAHPQLAEHQAKNARKRGIAVKLRALRDARGLTQEEVAAAAGMTQSVIARLESLSGPVPSLGSIERYVNACGGHFALLISDKQIDSEDAFRDAFVKARGRISSDIDLDVE
ncbi:helix-turn-helix domain-containing protein [Cribrihabitans pelagius]|uniref:helix-turn-helix domain-containing protein n=1 Tax=Cribrihabitans pelagius TaxID=1765746 RepID=UPI003B59AF00